MIDPLFIGDDYFYDKLCHAKEKDWKGQKLNQMAQAKQEDWAGKWVNEMIRIAKPGVPVIIENMALPYCDMQTDFGGVSKEFWVPAVDKYGWDVDPTSFAFADDKYVKGRYQVSMRKRKNGADSTTPYTKN